MENNPMKNKRCGAHSRRTGEPCRKWAMKNGRCKFHGGMSTGPRKGSQNALSHGATTAEEKKRIKAARELLKDVLTATGRTLV